MIGPAAARRRLASERGFALPVVMGALLLMLIFLATASTRATVGLGTSRKDVASKRALQTAKTGLRVAMARTSAVGLDLNQLLAPSQQCLVLQSNALTLQALGGGNTWCPAVGEDLGTGALYSYRVRSVNTSPSIGGLIQLGWRTHTLTRRIVSTGTVDGVTRRVTATATATGRRFAIGILFINVVSQGELESYRLDPGTFRECTPQPPTPSDPESGC